MFCRDLWLYPNIFILAQSIDWNEWFCDFRNLSSSRTIFDKKSLNLRCVLTKCLPLWQNTADYGEAGCRLDCWLNHINSYTMYRKLCEMYKFLHFGGWFSHISIIHNFMIRGSHIHLEAIIDHLSFQVYIITNMP